MADKADPTSAFFLLAAAKQWRDMAAQLQLLERCVPDHSSLVHEGSVDQLDLDATGHGRLNASGDLDQLTGGGFRVSEGTFGGELHR
jgi:hypothetical protein